MRILCAILLLFLFSFSIIAQTSEAKKIDEFGKINAESLTSILQNFIIILNSEPNSIGQVLIHSGKDETLGFPYKYGAVISSYIEFSKFKEARFRVNICEPEEKRRIEFWLIPNIQSLKTCKNELPNPTETILFDKINYSNPSVMGCCIVDEFDDAEREASTDAFAKLLKNKQTAKGYIFFYLGTNIYWLNERTVRGLDSPNLMREMLSQTKKILAKNGIDASRVRLINGGYRDSTRNIELWYVPQNGKIPKVKPNYFPKNHSTKQKK